MKIIAKQSVLKTKAKLFVVLFAFIFFFACQRENRNTGFVIDENARSASNVNESIEENNTVKFEHTEIVDVITIAEHELYEVTKNTSMNTLYAASILFTEEGGDTKELYFIGDSGNDTFRIGANNVRIDFWRKGAEFDRDFMFRNRYNPDIFTEMEENIINRTHNFPMTFFNVNIRENERNGIVFVDSFQFAAFEAESIFLSRRIYLSTNNFNIRIVITAHRESVGNFTEEVPEYFRIGMGGLTAWENWKTIERFGYDLLNGTLESRIVNNWFMETEKVLDGMNLVGMMNM